MAENAFSPELTSLQKRDKEIRDKRSRHTNLATAIVVTGTCTDMCPEMERLFRSETKQVSSLEMGPDNTPDFNRFVKEYKRSSADQSEPLPNELRPVAVLNRTMDYLVCNILDRAEHDPSITGDWYDFMWSRTRAIRKDITQQHLCDLDAVTLMEKCVRFHIHCAAALAEEDVVVFDQKINSENLSKCMQSLKDFYDDLTLEGIVCPNEAEFRTYDILLNLRDGEKMRDIRNLSPNIRSTDRIQFATRILNAYSGCNYIQFFKLVKGSPHYLNACLLHRYFMPVRCTAVRLMRKAYSVAETVAQLDANVFRSQLGFDDINQVAAFCDAVGLPFDGSIELSRKGGDIGNPNLQMRSRVIVEGKRDGLSVGLIVNGQGPLPPNPFKQHPLQCSFDASGSLIYEKSVFSPTQSDQVDDDDDGIDDQNDDQSSNVSSTSPPQPNATTNIFAAFNKPGTSSSLGSMSPPQNVPFSFDMEAPKFSFTNALQATEATAPVEAPSPSPSPSPTPPTLTEEESLHLQTSLEDRVMAQVTDEAVKSVVIESMIGHKLINTFMESAVMSFLTVEVAKSYNTFLEEKRILQNRNLMASASKLITSIIVDMAVDFILPSVVEPVHASYRRQFIKVSSDSLSKRLIEECTMSMTQDVVSDAIQDERFRQEADVQRLLLARKKRVANKFFHKWVAWLAAIKRKKFLMDTFPAASGNSHPVVITPVINDPSPIVETTTATVTSATKKRKTNTPTSTPVPNKKSHKEPNEMTKKEPFKVEEIKTPAGRRKSLGAENGSTPSRRSPRFIEILKRTETIGQGDSVLSPLVTGVNQVLMSVEQSTNKVKHLEATIKHDMK